MVTQRPGDLAGWRRSIWKETGWWNAQVADVIKEKKVAKEYYKERNQINRESLQLKAANKAA